MFNSVSSLFSQRPSSALIKHSDNNYCSLPNYANSQDWDYASWDTWATTKSPNGDVKIFIGAPASQTAANAGMFVDAATLGKIATETRSSFKSFGGVMLWSASPRMSILRSLLIEI